MKTIWNYWNQMPTSETKALQLQTYAPWKYVIKDKIAPSAFNRLIYQEDARYLCKCFIQNYIQVI